MSKASLPKHTDLIVEIDSEELRDSKLPDREAVPKMKIRFSKIVDAIFFRFTMPIVCSISGYPPEEPVISKDGYIFEKRIIESFIAENGKCPVTGSQLTLEDIRPVVVNNGNKALAVDSASLPELFKSFQTEWERLQVDSFNTKAQLDLLNQELSTCMYQQEASLRLISELTRERDTALSEVARLQEELAALNSNSRN